MNFGQFLKGTFIFKMCVQFQNVLSFSKCRDWDNFFKAFAGVRITKPLFYSMNMLPNWSAFLSLDGGSYKWRLSIDVQSKKLSDVLIH